MRGIKRAIGKVAQSISAITFVCIDTWQLKSKVINSKNKLFKRLFLLEFERRLAKQGSWIGWNSNIDNIPTFPHGMSGIFISGDSHIGKDCVIFQQVTIGSNTLVDSKTLGSPTISDSCYIGAGAKIIGAITIGKNCRIGANCIVVKDMPDNSVAVMPSARIIQKENLDNRFIQKGKDGWGYRRNGEFIPDKDIQKTIASVTNPG